jgi:hypothetical protein
MSLTLLPGRYTVSLKNPDTTEPIVVEVDVVVGKSARAPLAEFETLDATQVLEKYGL